MAIKVQIPDFEWSGMYYQEILDDLIQWKRNNLPEFNDESDEEPLMQLLKGISLAAHLNNVLLDLVAKERFLPTASLRASVGAHLKLIDYNLRQASPATADLLLELAQVFTATQTIVPVGSKFSTVDGETSAIDYEVLEVVSTVRTDQFTDVYAYDASLDSFTDHTTQANSLAGDFTPGWTGVPAVGDALYFGHTDALWNMMSFIISTGAADIDAGVWEFYDGNFEYINPDEVINNGTTLTFRLNGWLGDEDRTGTIVRVKNNATNGYEDIEVEFVGGYNRITTTGFLGQGIPSTAADEYLVGSEWKPLKSLVDGTELLTETGSVDVTYELPQTLLESWSPTTINDVSAYWIRFRVCAATGSPTCPDIAQVRMDTGKQYVVCPASQGTSQSDDPVGSSTGLPSQQFQLARYPVIDDSTLRVFVTESVEDEWARVANFLNSTTIDKHYTIDFDDDGRCTITFPDGVTGKIPAAGTNNIRVTYRTMEAGQNGNVGANSIAVNKSGIGFVNSVTNPRSGAGYKVRDGDTAEDLARVKIAGPALLRTNERATNVSDVEALSAAFQTSTGTTPVARALAIEESFGPKTVEVVVVGNGGSGVALSDRDELETYFNGNAEQKIEGKLMLNHEATVTNFTPSVIDVTATVYGGNLTAVKTALTALLSPVATEDDGVTYVWDFGGEVPLSKIISAIQTTSPAPRKVTLTSPSGDTGLGARELPVPGTLTITIVA